MAAGGKRPDRPEVAEAAVRDVWLASKAVARGLPRFAGGKSFGGRMTSRAHAAAALPGVRGLVFLGFPLHPPEKPGIERAEHLDAAAGPLLFVQGTKDKLAQLPLLRPVLKRLGRRVTLQLLDGADHGMSRTRDLDTIATATAEWIDAILDTE
jgi:predicted alpha/beta-hydrolase family hydrolase